MIWNSFFPLDWKYNEFQLVFWFYKKIIIIVNVVQ